MGYQNMKFNELHAKFKDDDSPSVEGQIRWLQKQGFQQHQIEQAMLTAYSELHAGRVPQRWKRTMKGKEDQEVIERKFGTGDTKPKGSGWDSRDIKNGFEFDQFILDCAKRVRTDELSIMLRHMEKFEKDLKKKWSTQVPWYKRMFGVKPQETTE